MSITEENNRHLIRDPAVALPPLEALPEQVRPAAEQYQVAMSALREAEAELEEMTTVIVNAERADAVKLSTLR